MTGDPTAALDPSALKTLPDGWRAEGGKLVRDFAFSTYQQGVEFAVQVAALAETQGHHPDLHIGYRRVTLSYFTHDVGGLTGADFAAARAVNTLLDGRERLP